MPTTKKQDTFDEQLSIHTGNQYRCSGHLQNIRYNSDLYSSLIQTQCEQGRQSGGLMASRHSLDMVAGGGFKHTRRSPSGQPAGEQTSVTHLKYRFY